MLRTPALDLPEIRSILANSLDIKELAACARVSQNWNDTFTPLLYSYVTLSTCGPSQESFEKNMHHVRYLKVTRSENQKKISISNFKDLAGTKVLTHL